MAQAQGRDAFEAWLRLRTGRPRENWGDSLEVFLTDCGSVSPASTGEALSQMQRVLRLRHYSPRTEKTYLGWARRFLQHLENAGLTASPDAVRAYLSHLATTREVASSTQNQAFNALLFLCRNVLEIDLGDMGAAVRARRGPKLPVVLSVEEVRSILQATSGTGRRRGTTAHGAGTWRLLRCRRR